MVNVSSDSVILSWLRPVRVPGLLRGYRLERQGLRRGCEPEDERSCVEDEVVLSLEGKGEGERVTLQPLLKYTRYRFRVTALTNAGAGAPTEWIYIQTLAGSTFNFYTELHTD